MKRLIVSFLTAVLFAANMMGQTYNELWKQVVEAEQRDLPQTQLKSLRQIAEKAEKEKAYGQLLKAELTIARVAAVVSPDSLLPVLERLKQREQSADHRPLQAVMQAVISIIYTDHPQLTDDAAAQAEHYKKKAITAPAELAAVRAADYEPFIVKGSDSRMFDDDLLSIIGYETHQMEAIHRYYLTTDNRQAQLLTALSIVSQQPRKPSLATTLDSLMALYGDLPVCGEAAIEKVSIMRSFPDFSAKETMTFIDEALARWQSWKRINELVNTKNEMTALQYHATAEHSVIIPNQPQAVRLFDLRGISELTMRIYRVSTDGDTNFHPNDKKGYAKLKPLLTPLSHATVTRRYDGRESYELYNDSIVVSALPVGVYLIELESTPKTQVWRQLYYVSNLRVLSQGLPNKQMRYVTVDATTGQPVGGTSIRLTSRSQRDGSDIQTTVSTNAQGEYIYQYKDNPPYLVFAMTKDDRACPPMNSYGTFSFRNSLNLTQNAHVFTDRAIYRPGQTVHVAAILYNVANGFEHQALKNHTVTVRLYDANYKQIEEHSVTTDDYGTAATHFTLPSNGLTGQFHIDVDNHRQFFRVEEYKRPTFEVEIARPTVDYKAGDTLTVTATARSYAGVPVQHAHVRYRVERRQAWWWFSQFRSAFAQTNIQNLANILLSGEATTDAEGRFEVTLPLVLPATAHPLFCQFVVTADVTDAAGETRHGELSLPLGNRMTALSLDMPDKLLAEDMPHGTFHLRNAAGTDLDDIVSYRIDNGKWLSVKTNTPSTIFNEKSKSGQHTLEAVCAGDTLKQSFVVFSLNDQRPATKTDDWFYASASQFPHDGTPVTVQVGSSDNDVHIVYTIVADEKVIESGAVDKSNALVNRKFCYKKDYGNGLAIRFAWVKNGKAHLHEVNILRPMPDKKLRLRWETFRDRLTPGQQEEWTLSVMAPSEKQPGVYEPAEAQLMATLYDKSLDQLSAHNWSFAPLTSIARPHLRWMAGNWPSLYFNGFKQKAYISVEQLAFNHFDRDCFPMPYFGKRFTRGTKLMRAPAAAPEREPSVQQSNAKMFDAIETAADEGALYGRIAGLDLKAKSEETLGNATPEEGQMLPELRQNLQETAFFCPQLTTDSTGTVSMKFTLPESLTTWHFMGLAHTQDMMYGLLEGEAVAQKDVMIQPNIPRFLRMGDEAVIAARIINTTELPAEGNVRLQLLHAETEEPVFDARQAMVLQANATQTASFTIPAKALNGHSLLICRMTVAGNTFADGEQHYLPILPHREHVTVTVPYTQNAPGTKTIDLSTLIPRDAQQAKLTFEYTNNPSWLLIQALPTIGHPHDDCVVCQTVALYANSIGRHLLKQNPRAKHVFENWKNETGDDTSLQSALAKNEALKDVLLAETPWVADADRETEQKQALGDFFDDNLLSMRHSSALAKIQKLQNADGSWSWWEGMPGSVCITAQVCEMLTRLEKMTNSHNEVLLNKAYSFLDSKMLELVANMKKEERKGHRQVFPGRQALHYLYISTLARRDLPSRVAEAQSYLKKLLKQQKKDQSIYGKALSAIILNDALYAQSLKEYTVYREDMGRYYDTPRAAYSWRDYRIPTQVAAIEALQLLTPHDTTTIEQMRRWLLHEKRTQAWDTPLNSADAIYAFLNGHNQALAPQAPAQLAVDGKQLPTSQATAGIGYVKTSMTLSSMEEDSEATPPHSFTATKTSQGTSWGAVYAQFLQPTSSIATGGSGLSVKREITGKLSVGSRIKIRITIVADHDYDFVEVADRRAACMEPTNQLSGYRHIPQGGGYYCAPKDNATYYYFDLLPKGKHVLETEYYIDRTGQYESGTCTVACAYAPEFRAVDHSLSITVTEQ